MNLPDRPKFLDIARRNHSLGREVRIRIGGSASYFARVASRDQLKDAIEFSERQKLPFYILGKGSNVILSDEGFDGVVVTLVGEFERISFDDEGNFVTAGAGASLIKLGLRLAQEGYEGFTYMGVIPGTVGGAVRINAGTTREGEVKDRFLSADILSADGWTLQTRTAEEMRFGYRTSALLRSRDVVLDATFRLPEDKESSPGKALADLKQANSTRRAKQPRSPRTVGSTFRKPIDGEHPAGWYLDRVGMKGMRVGGAVISEEHANWIVNVDNATSADCKALIDIGRERVLEKYGIRLEREVVFLPEDMEEWA